MTDDTTNTNTNATDESSSFQRRTFMSLGLASPALAGLGVTALDSQLGAAASTSQTETTLSSASERTAVDDVRVTSPTSEQAEIRDDYGLVSVSADVLSTLDAEVGEQVRIRRTDDEYAVYTVAEKRDESESTVRMNGTAKSRLALADAEWVGQPDCRLDCPRPEDTTPLADESFPVTVESVVPAPDLSVAAARDESELVEKRVSGGTELLVLAPNGGDVEPRTAAQADRLRETFTDATSWVTHGFRDEGGAFVRWHVPSYAISPASFPQLAAVAQRRYDRAVSFHGTCSEQIQIGGGASKAVRAGVRDCLNRRLPEDASSAVLADERYRADSEHVLVNQLTTDQSSGVWVGTPVEDREQHWKAISDAVADALRSD
ncbi:poly-gamma-glutamate hydrolase family protein [Halogranum rubrum]|uniref:Uncharacterized protein n=1 Tax=Halogranum salarium B-1 TaxID=1210908 RepID=J3EV49_9EURY|nr:poly-gamma-glutamate hydrolase family protein [Halogranum salarium]EJN58422.1 hypothetical protein HSB1_38390 [Halogranum salarium B-1]